MKKVLTASLCVLLLSTTVIAGFNRTRIAMFKKQEMRLPDSKKGDQSVLVLVAFALGVYNGYKDTAMDYRGTSTQPTRLMAYNETDFSGFDN